MIIDELTVGSLATNCYILSNEDRKDCIVIDPGAEASRIRAHVGDKKIAAILLTHGHFDHFGAVRELMEADTQLLMHAEDIVMLSDPYKNASMDTIGGEATAPEPTRTVTDNEELELAGLKIRVLHTPGHTRGCVVYIIEDEMFTGDTMFRHGWGRTDLYGGDQAQMMKSLRRLIPLSRNMPVHPGHED